MTDQRAVIRLTDSGLSNHFAVLEDDFQRSNHKPKRLLMIGAILQSFWNEAIHIKRLVPQCCFETLNFLELHFIELSALVVNRVFG